MALPAQHRYNTGIILAPVQVVDHGKALIGENGSIVMTKG